MSYHNPTVKMIASDTERMANLAGKIRDMQAELQGIGLHHGKRDALWAMLGTNEINEFEYLAAFAVNLDMELA